MSVATCFSAMPYHRPSIGRQHQLELREVAEGDDVQVTTAAAMVSGAWRRRLESRLPGCRTRFVVNGHRYGDLVSITTADGEQLDLAQTPTRPTNSLVRNASRGQLRLISSLMTVGLVLARM